MEVQNFTATQGRGVPPQAGLPYASATPQDVVAASDYALQLEERSRPVEAIQYRERSLELAAQVYGAYSQDVLLSAEALTVRCNQLAMKYLSEDDFQNAFHLLRKAEGLTNEASVLAGEERLRLKLRAATYNNLGIFYRRRNKLDAAWEYLEYALAIESAMPDICENPAATHLNACAVLSQMKRHQTALEHAMQALNILRHPSKAQKAKTRSPASNDPSMLAVAWHNAGVQYEFLNNYPTACECYLKALNTAVGDLGTENPTTMAMQKSYQKCAEKRQRTGPLLPRLASGKSSVMENARRGRTPDTTATRRGQSPQDFARTGPNMITLPPGATHLQTVQYPNMPHPPAQPGVGVAPHRPPHPPAHGLDKAGPQGPPPRYWAPVQPMPGQHPHALSPGMGVPKGMSKAPTAPPGVPRPSGFRRKSGPTALEKVTAPPPAALSPQPPAAPQGSPTLGSEALLQQHAVLEAQLRVLQLRAERLALAGQQGKAVAMPDPTSPPLADDAATGGVAAAPAEETIAVPAVPAESGEAMPEAAASPSEGVAAPAPDSPRSSKRSRKPRSRDQKRDKPQSHAPGQIQSPALQASFGQTQTLLETIGDTPVSPTASDPDSPVAPLDDAPTLGTAGETPNDPTMLRAPVSAGVSETDEFGATDIACATLQASEFDDTADPTESEEEEEEEESSSGKGSVPVLPEIGTVEDSSSEIDSDVLDTTALVERVKKAQQIRSSRRDSKRSKASSVRFHPPAELKREMLSRVLSLGTRLDRLHEEIAEEVNVGQDSLKEQRERLLQQEYHAALDIQRVWQGSRARHRVNELRQARLERWRVEREIEAIGFEAACTLQRAWRCTLARQRLRQRRLEFEAKINKDSTTIQMHMRPVLAQQLRRQKWINMRTAAVINIQRLGRGHASRCWFVPRMAVSRDEAEKRAQAAAVTIQRYTRGYLARKCRNELQAEKDEVLRLRKEEFSALRIQTQYRRHRHQSRHLAYLADKRQQEVDRQQKVEALQRRQALVQASAAVLQRAWRCCAARMATKAHRAQKQQQRRDYMDEQTLAYAATRIQGYRRVLIAKKQMAQQRVLRMEEERLRNISYEMEIRATLEQQLHKAMVEKATAIQCTWRGFCVRRQLREERQRQINEWQAELQALDHMYAIKIQKAWRGLMGRRAAALRILEHQEECATRIAAAWRGAAARAGVRFARERRVADLATYLYETTQLAAALQLQAVFRRWRAERQVRELRLQRRRLWAVPMIQRIYRGHRGRQMWLRLWHARQERLARTHVRDRVTLVALTLQCAWRSYRARVQVHGALRAVHTIQRAWRRSVARAASSKAAEKERVRLRLVFDRDARDFAAAEAAAQRRSDAAQTLQRWFRTLAAFRIARAAQQRHRERLQAGRAKDAAALEALRAKLSTIVDSAVAENWTDKQRLEYVATRDIQRMFRGVLARGRIKIMRRQLRELEEAQHIRNAENILQERRDQAATQIQAKTRGFLVRKAPPVFTLEDKIRAEEEEWAVLLLQAVARGMRDRKRVRGMRAAVLQLQAAVRSAWSAHYRAALAAQAAERDAQRSQNRLDNAALCIQCAWRRHGAVQELARRRAVRNREILTVLQAEREAAALTLQTAQRRKYAQALIKIRKDEYQDRLAAVRHAEAQGYIGRMWKMHVAQEVTEEYRSRQSMELEAEESAEQQDFAAVREWAAVTIQRTWRGYQCRKALATQRELDAIAAEVAVSNAKAKELEERHTAALLIQSHWRRYVAQKELRHRLDLEHRVQRQLVEEDAANTIQRAWHGSQQRAADRRALEAATRACEAAEQDTAAVAMQRVWRGFAVRQENTAALLKAAQKRAEEENFAAIKIQSWWRMILGMKEALRLREERVNLKDDKVREDAACMIQTQWRMKMARNELQRRKMERSHEEAQDLKEWAKTMSMM